MKKAATKKSVKKKDVSIKDKDVSVNDLVDKAVDNDTKDLAKASAQDNTEDSVENTLDSPLTQNLDEFSYDLKIPQDRVGALIGKDGETKDEIETLTESKLDISKEGDVIITGTDGLKLYTTREIVHAIGRGFNPRTALLLLKTDYAFELIDLKEIGGKNKNVLERLKGRVIGTAGKSREEIERLTDTYISIYGKTIGIIGETQQVSLARQAVAMLLQGSLHRTVYNFLERKRKEILFGQRIGR